MGHWQGGVRQTEAAGAIANPPPNRGWCKYRSSGGAQADDHGKGRRDPVLEKRGWKNNQNNCMINANLNVWISNDSRRESERDLMDGWNLPQLTITFHLQVWDGPHPAEAIRRLWARARAPPESCSVTATQTQRFSRRPPSGREFILIWWMFNMLQEQLAQPLLSRWKCSGRTARDAHVKKRAWVWTQLLAVEQRRALIFQRKHKTPELHPRCQ